MRLAVLNTDHAPLAATAQPLLEVLDRRMHDRYHTDKSATYGRFWPVWALDALSGRLRPCNPKLAPRRKREPDVGAQSRESDQIAASRRSWQTRRNADSGRHHRGRRAGRAGGGHRRQAGRARLLDHREGRARQFDLQVSGQHGVLHHAGAARDRRAAAGVAVRKADAPRSAALLPARRRYLRAGDRVRRAGRSTRVDLRAERSGEARRRDGFLRSRRGRTKACAGSGTAAT